MFRLSENHGINLYTRFETPSNPSSDIILTVERCINIGVKDGRVGDYDVDTYVEVKIPRAEVEVEEGDNDDMGIRQWMSEYHDAVSLYGANLIVDMTIFCILLEELTAMVAPDRECEVCGRADGLEWMPNASIWKCQQCSEVNTGIPNVFGGRTE